MNILIVASRYPEMDSGNNKATEFMQFFATEWAKEGHDVFVYHAKPKFPSVVQRLVRAGASMLRKNKDLVEYHQYRMEGKDAAYEYKGVRIVRRQIRKWFPKFLCGWGAVRKAADTAFDYIMNINFVPDVIVVDFINPGAFIAPILAKWLRIPSVVVLHETDYDYLKAPLTAKRALAGLRQVDFIGFRSEPARQDFARRYYEPKDSIVWYSGIPDHLLLDPAAFVPRTEMKRFVTVGRMIKRKNFDITIRAFDRVNVRQDCRFQFIGYGSEQENLQALAGTLDSAEAITFAGKIPREAVLDQMAAADVFVFVPHNETFGMVYVEAMSRGCLVVAATGTGADGIIVHGVNGWLVAPGDEDALLQTLRDIDALSREEIAKVSRAAFETASAMSDSALAAQIAAKLKDCIRIHRGA